MRDISNIVILTGAGISAESGIATFRPRMAVGGPPRRGRGDSGGFARDPALVQRFYDARRARLKEVEPNAAHLALARLDAEWPGELLIVTQNVDDLHERAGARRILHMHGELKSAWCLACDERVRWEEDLGHGPACPACGTSGQLRPDIVWFGEMPYEMERIDRALMAADLFVSIGTSGAVYPAAGFVQTARYCGAHTLEINLEPEPGQHLLPREPHGTRRRTGARFGRGASGRRRQQRFTLSAAAGASFMPTDTIMKRLLLAPLGLLVAGPAATAYSQQARRRRPVPRGAQGDWSAHVNALPGPAPASP
jgi:NAD-dependent deacetylase